MQLLIGIVLGGVLSFILFVTLSKLPQRKDPVAQVPNSELANLKGRRCGVYLRTPGNLQHSAQGWLENDLINVGMTLTQLDAQIAKRIAAGGQWDPGISRQPVDIVILGFWREHNSPQMSTDATLSSQNCKVVWLDLRYYNAPDGEVIGTFSEMIDDDLEQLRQKTRECVGRIPKSLSEALQQYARNLAD